MNAIPVSVPIPIAMVGFIHPPAAKKPAMIDIIISAAKIAFLISNLSLRLSRTITPSVMTSSVAPYSFVIVFVNVSMLEMSVTFCGMTVVTFIGLLM